MAKIGIAPINSIAVTSCVICLAAGALIGAALHHPAALIVSVRLSEATCYLPSKWFGNGRKPRFCG